MEAIAISWFKPQDFIGDSTLPNKSKALLGLLLLGAGLLTGFLLFMHRLGSGGDNLDYLIYIRSLMNGEWDVIKGWRYPPGYPIAAALALSVSGMEIPFLLSNLTNEPIYFLHALNIVFFAFAAVVFWLKVENTSTPAWIPFTAALLWAVNQTSAATASQIASEPLFLLLSMVALGCWRSATNDPSTRLGNLLLAMIVTTLCLLTRTAGLAVVATALFMAAWNWRRLEHPWQTLAAAAIPFFVYAAYVLVTQQTAYMEVMLRGSFGEHEASQPLVTRLLANGTVYLRSSVDLLLPKVMGTYGILDLAGLIFLEVAYGLVILVLLFIGLIAYIRKHGVTIGLVYVAATLGMILVQPYRENRYLIPILPFLMIYWLNGLHYAWGFLPKIFGGKGRWRSFGIAFLALLALWNVAVNGYAGVKNWRNIIMLRHQPAWAPERYILSRENDFADFIAASIWLGQHVPTNSIIYSRKPSFTYLASGRHAVPTLTILTHHDLWREVSQQATQHPVYIINDVFTPGSFYAVTRQRIIEPFLEEYNDHVIVVHESVQGTTVVEIKPVNSNSER